MQTIHGFLSGIEKYSELKDAALDPVIVATEKEWDSTVRDLATQRSLRVRTTILPPGVTMNDPRLAEARIKTTRLYKKPLGEYFDVPSTTFVAGVAGNLTPPAPGYKPGQETFYQIIPKDKLVESLCRAQETSKISLMTMRPFAVQENSLTESLPNTIKKQDTAGPTDWTPLGSFNSDLNKTGTAEAVSLKQLGSPQCFVWINPMLQQCETITVETCSTVDASEEHVEAVEDEPEKVSQDKDAAQGSRSSAQPHDDLESFFASVESLENAQETKKKGEIRLPGFLFPDGQDKLLVNGAVGEEVTASDTVKRDCSEGSDSASLLLSASEECERLTKETFSNSFKVLRLPLNASEKSVKQAFRRLSLLIHPDKCRHPRAEEAFLVVNKAYEELQRPKHKEKYALVYNEAEKRVMKNLSKTNKRLQKQKLPLLDTNPAAVQDKITEMCEKLLVEFTEAQEYAEKCRKANENLEREAEEALLREERENAEQKKKWEATMEIRVEGWRDFMEGIRTKRLKVEAFVPVTHQREQRKPGDKSVPSKPRGIDEAYKQNWR